jgi:hypothetical protein
VEAPEEPVVEIDERAPRAAVIGSGLEHSRNVFVAGCERQVATPFLRFADPVRAAPPRRSTAPTGN